MKFLKVLTWLLCTIIVLLLAISMLDCGTASTNQSPPSTSQAEEEMPVVFLKKEEQKSEQQKALVFINTFLGNWGKLHWDQLQDAFSFPLSVNQETMDSWDSLKSLFNNWIKANMGDPFPLLLSRIDGYQPLKDVLSSIEGFQESMILPMIEAENKDQTFIALFDVGAALDFAQLIFVVTKRIPPPSESASLPEPSYSIVKILTF